MLPIPSSGKDALRLVNKDSMIDKKDYIFGLRAVIEAIEAGKDIDKLLVRKGLQGELARAMLQKARQADVPVQYVPAEKLNRITAKNHQGAIALMSAVTYYPLDQVVAQTFEDGGVPLMVMLDGVTDTRNFGAIGRTADCAGANGIIIPDRGSVTVNADAVKTSAGALLTLPVSRVRSLVDAVRYLKDSGMQVVAATEKSIDAYTNVDFTLPTVIVMGAEDVGISPAVLAECTASAAIPILGTVGSLNVSVASAVILYEAVRQRLKAGM